MKLEHPVLVVTWTFTIIHTKYTFTYSRNIPKIVGSFYSIAITVTIYILFVSTWILGLLRSHKRGFWMIVGFLTVDYQLTGNCQGFGISIQRCTYVFHFYLFLNLPTLTFFLRNSKQNIYIWFWDVQRISTHNMFCNRNCFNFYHKKNSKIHEVKRMNNSIVKATQAIYQSIYSTIFIYLPMGCSNGHNIHLVTTYISGPRGPLTKWAMSECLLWSHSEVQMTLRPSVGP